MGERRLPAQMNVDYPSLVSSNITSLFPQMMKVRNFHAKALLSLFISNFNFIRISAGYQTKQAIQSSRFLRRKAANGSNCYKSLVAIMESSSNMS